MSTALYNEAIADAKELVRMAEQNATNKLVEAVAPRIRKLVEKKLLNEDDTTYVANDPEDDESDSDDESTYVANDPEDDESEESDYTGSEEDFDEVPSDDMDVLGSMFQDDDDDLDMDDDDMSGGMRIPSDRVKRISIEFEEGDEPKAKNAKESKKKGKTMLSSEGLELTKESIDTLLRIVDGNGTVSDRIKEARLELKVIGRALGALNEGRVRRGAALRIVESFNGVLRRALALQVEVGQLPRGPMRDSSTKQLSTLTKEIKEMSTRSMLRALLEREEMKRGNEGMHPEEEGGMYEMYEEDDAAADEGGDEGDMAADEGGDESMLDKLEALGVDIEALKAELEGGGEEEEAPAEEEEGATEEGDYHEMGSMMESRRRLGRRDPVYTIDESMLRRELHRLRRLREEIEPTDSFGGPPEEEEDLESVLTSDLNVYGDELGSVSEAKKADAAKKAREAKKAKEAKMKEAEKAEKEKEAKEKEKAMKESRINRALRSRLAEATATLNSMRRQLDEQKLFNAKLLYVNKLMQNKSISERQLRSIVEALDGAGTLREAQLLYKSLTESLARSSGGNLSEGANRIAGNSSRSTRPGGLVNESVEVDRWAVLAGLKG